ncbi:MAG TPA: hypothetical protein DEB25_02340 [Desulfobulbaceae bacterium]|nr:hypothetical protein [Desulfobulbaceae bacterium]
MTPLKSTMKRIIMSFLLAVCLLAMTVTRPTESQASETARFRIVAGTTLIADIVQDLLPGQVDVITLIPASSCPGHHDMRATDMAFFSGSSLVLLHSWQKEQDSIVAAARSAGLPQERLKTVAARGSLLVPSNQIAASRKTAALLATLPDADAITINKRLDARIKRIETLSAASLASMAPYRKTPVLSAVMQEEFAHWLGLKIIGVYGRAEELSPKTMMSLASLGKKNDARLVIDNDQSGAEAGLPLAREIGAAHVSFSNFPILVGNKSGYEGLVAENVRLLISALAQP